MAAQTVGTEDPTFTPACEGEPANPARPRVELKHSGRTAAGVPADSRHAQTDDSPGVFNGVWIV